MPRMIWHDDRADPELAGNVGSVQRTSPAVRDHCEIARIMPPLDGRHLDGGGHRQRSKVDNSGGDPVQGLVQSRPKLSDGLLRGYPIELDLAVEKTIRVQAAEDQVRVGDGWLLAACPVATIRAPISLTAAMLPPPAPTSTISSTAACTG